MRFLELRVPTERKEEQLRFYGDVLGLEQASDGLRAGATLLRFEPAPLESPLHFAFNVPENQIAEAHEWIAARAGVLGLGNVEIIDFGEWNAHAVYFRDAEDNVVELIARHDMPNGSDEPFSGDSLLEVSEVGVPTTDVAEVVDTLAAELGAALYAGDRSQFAAVGDGHGLLIVVRRGRRWFPTEHPGLAAPLEVTARGTPAAIHALPGTACRIRLSDS